MMGTVKDLMAAMKKLYRPHGFNVASTSEGRGCGNRRAPPSPRRAALACRQQFHGPFSVPRGWCRRISDAPSTKIARSPGIRLWRSTTDGRDAAQKEDGREAASPKKAPFGLLAGAWFVPGLGHWLLGRKKRAIVFAVVITCSFITGVLIDGELGTPKPQNPFSWLAAFACLGNGILYLGRMLWLNGFADLLGGIPFGLQGGGNPIGGRICVRQHVSLHRRSDEPPDGARCLGHRSRREGVTWTT